MTEREQTMDEKVHNAGLAIRREVLGDKHVDQSLASATDFSKPMQDLVAEYCWGTIWTREALDRRSRSVLNLGMMTALNRSRELKLHVRGAIRNGLSVEEIREVLLQTAVYCGIPAALEAFAAAEAVLTEMGVMNNPEDARG
jgi:4-carboxymuconolactone decarboxylase